MMKPAGLWPAMAPVRHRGMVTEQVQESGIFSCEDYFVSRSLLG